MRSDIAAALLAFLLTGQSGERRRPPHPPTHATDAGSSSVVPAGAIIPLELKNTVNSRTAYVEQSIYAETIFPVVVGQRILIPVHSYVRGEITEVIRPGRVSGKAMLGLRCDEIVLPDGTTAHMSARVTELAGSRIQAGSDADGGKDDSGDASKSDGSALVDASAMPQQSAIVDAGGILDPSVSGAAEGVGGLVMTLATRGRVIVLRPGTTFELQLTQPLDLKRSSPEVAKRK
jgi:hypothetical protein